ncbi:MAG TPA: dihydroorotate dehydrogenase [Candidatus Acidoferrales bacterium]|nr:dihydroorotate dehydrogenase [Candidatus Acidoferrales bacterium]
MKPALKVKIGNLELKNPLMTASGTCGYGDELNQYFDISTLGAVVTKSLTLRPKIGNEPQRITEVPSGMINSIGLANIGIEKFIGEKLPRLRKSGAVIIANIAAKRVEDYVSLAEQLSVFDDIKGLELNLSCPNVKEGGIEFGTDRRILASIVKQVRKVFPRTMIVKLTPNVTRISDFAEASEAEGADAVTVANTYVGMAIDIYKRAPKIHTVTGGYSGPAIKPLTLAKVFHVYNAVKIPIIASGGIFVWQDVIEYLLAGAAAVEVGTVLFTKPDVTDEFLNEIESYLSAMKISTITELVGSLSVNISDAPHLRAI